MLVTQDGKPLVTQDNRIIEASIETNIDRCRRIKKEIEILQAEYDMLKKGMIEGYFASNDTYITSQGLVLATYKGQIRQQFKTVEFKKDHPEMYDNYSDLKEIKTFLIK